MLVVLVLLEVLVVARLVTVDDEVVGTVVTDDVEVVEMVVTVVSVVTVVVLVVLVVGGPQSPSGLQTAFSTKAPPRLAHVTSSMSPPMAHEPSN